MNATEMHGTVLQLPFMHQLPDNVREQVAISLTEVANGLRMRQGSVLFREGEEGTDDGYVLMTGQVEVRKSDAPSLTAEAPELLGEMKQFNPSAQRTATVEALEEIRVMHFKWSDFERILRNRLDVLDQEKVTQVLQDYAWQHFTT